jgi:hypothetical protein
MQAALVLLVASRGFFIVSEVNAGRLGYQASKWLLEHPERSQTIQLVLVLLVMSVEVLPLRF